MLTSRQLALLSFIDRSTRENVRSPTYREIQQGFGSDISATHWLLRRLEERGFVSQEHGRRRAIKILKMPMKVFVVENGEMVPSGQVVVTHVG